MKEWRSYSYTYNKTIGKIEIYTFLFYDCRYQKYNVLFVHLLAYHSEANVQI